MQNRTMHKRVTTTNSMAKQKIEVLFEDEWVVVANKPPFLRTLPDRYRKDLPNLLDFFRKKYGEIFIVHRLDKETSGIIILAKTKEAHKHLNQQFEKRTIDKSYLTLVEGNGFPENGKIEKAISSHPTSNRMKVSKKGKPSVTEFQLVEQFQNFALVEAKILTGRMHQIRVHFESIGFPLAVDAIYGRREQLSFTDIKKGKLKTGKDETETKPLIQRSTLHSWKIEFEHPTSTKRVNFEANPPKDLKATINQLRKWRGVGE